MSFVLDASVVAAWALPDKSSRIADRMLTRTESSGAIVPQLWWYEIRNLLVVAERRKRIAADEADAFLHHLERMAIRIAELGDGMMILSLARAHKLSVYDATYLELAKRENLPLGTLDGKLATAAAPEHVRLLKI